MNSLHSPVEEGSCLSACYLKDLIVPQFVFNPAEKSALKLNDCLSTNPPVDPLSVGQNPTALHPASSMKELTD